MKTFLKGGFIGIILYIIVIIIYFFTSSGLIYIPSVFIFPRLFYCLFGGPGIPPYSCGNTNFIIAMILTINFVSYFIIAGLIGLLIKKFFRKNNPLYV